MKAITYTPPLPQQIHTHTLHVAHFTPQKGGFNARHLGCRCASTRLHVPQAQAEVSYAQLQLLFALEPTQGKQPTSETPSSRTNL